MDVSMRLVRLSILTALIVCAFAGGADAATRGPCLPGKSKPRCYHWEGKVKFVADGDTLDVNVVGDRTSKPVRVRMTGINAMEQTKYSSYPDRREGHCHSLEATARLEELLARGRNRVRLSAQDPAASSGTRKRRAVAVRIGGRWTDLGAILVREGHALWLPGHGEWAWNSTYNRASQDAARAGLRLWDTDYCGHGPSEDAPLTMWVNWDADGSDKPRYRGEWVKIKNNGDTDVSLDGWWFRDSDTKSYAFPNDAVIPAGESLTLKIGRRPAGDDNTTTRFYWASRGPIFDNVGARGLGDGGYIFDPQGDLRAWMVYPCRVACGDPLKGRVVVTARPRAPEKVFLKNRGATPAYLEGYVVDNYPYVYSLDADAMLLPGERLRLMVKGSPANSTRLVRFWGKSKYILNDSGDRVSLRTQRNVRISCHAWGSRRC